MVESREIHAEFRAVVVPVWQTFPLVYRTWDSTLAAFPHTTIGIPLVHRVSCRHDTPMPPGCPMAMPEEFDVADQAKQPDPGVNPKEDQPRDHGAGAACVRLEEVGVGTGTKNFRHYP
jgi:hypothetical protein